MGFKMYPKSALSSAGGDRKILENEFSGFCGKFSFFIKTNKSTRIKMTFGIAIYILVFSTGGWGDKRGGK